MNNKHIAYMDIMKGLGIIAVVIGHTYSPKLMSQIINFYHMPLFFFAAGYFYKDKYNQEPVNFIIKRYKTLYVPFVAFQILFILLNNFFLNIGIYSEKFGSVYFKAREYYVYINSAIHMNVATWESTGAFWFITSLFTVSIAFCLISYYCFRLFKKYGEIPRAILIIGLFALGYYLATNKVSLYDNLQNTKYIYQSMICILIFYLGYWFNRIEKWVKFNIILAIAACVLIRLLANYGGISMASNVYTSPWFFLSAALLGIYVNLYISKLMDISRWNFKLIEYIGKHSLFILALHFLSFKLVNYLQVVYYSYPYEWVAYFPTLPFTNKWWIIYTIVGVFLPIGIVFAYEQNRKYIKNLRARLSSSKQQLQA